MDPNGGDVKLAPYYTHPLNGRYLSPDQAEVIRSEYTSSKPFRQGILPNFLDDHLLHSVAAELETETWFPKNNDLYTFLQTDDIKAINKPSISSLREAIYSKDFRAFLEHVTGIELHDKIDASASRYWSGCQLLCHDDELEGRRIAFIIYMVPPDWTLEDGGTLDLYDVDSQGQPDKIVKSIVPSWNSFLFFEVTPVSFHRVSEVLSTTKQRLSIGGWFHGSNVERPNPYIEPSVPRSLLAPNPDDDLKQWINPKYLQAKWQRRIAKHFEENSSIELQDFMVKSKYDQLVIAMQDKSSSVIPWQEIGPADRRHYHTLGRWGMTSSASISPIILQAIAIFQSAQFAHLLWKLTDLELTNSHVEVRRFKHGDYTLAQDNIEQHAECGLDAYYFLCPYDCWDVDVGGQVTYMDEENELITLVPLDNALCLAYRDVGCMKFVKYVNHEAPHERQEFAMLYWEAATTHGLDSGQN